MSTITINIKENALDKVLYILKNLPDIEIVEEKTKVDSDNKWSYWKDSELDNFGKIAIGLSKHVYDDEDFSKW